MKTVTDHFSLRKLQFIKRFVNQENLFNELYEDNEKFISRPLLKIRKIHKKKSSKKEFKSWSQLVLNKNTNLPDKIQIDNMKNKNTDLQLNRRKRVVQLKLMKTLEYLALNVVENLLRIELINMKLFALKHLRNDQYLKRLNRDYLMRFCRFKSSRKESLQRKSNNLIQ